MKTMKLGSLFDGSGGFPLAGSLCRIEPVWASEVEPYPIAVTKSRFPNMKHLGSVTDVHGGDIEPVDIITFGSPCQDLSVAGKRAGLKHESNGDDETTRSGLFMEAVRIIKEMREATNGNYPRFALWENVPGAFSSNKGEDFRTVLEELIKIVEPTAVMPAVPKNGWPYSDSYCGDGWSLAYRVFDAQYWGVPQRRRRIYLVLDLRGQRAGKVSFERKGLRGNFAESGTPWKAVAGDATNRTGADDCDGECTGKGAERRLDALGCDLYNLAVSGNVAISLTANTGTSCTHSGPTVAIPYTLKICDENILDDQGGQQITVRTDGKAPTLRAETHGNLPCVLESTGFKAGQSMAGGIGWQEECAATLAAQCSGTEPTVCVKCYDARGNGDGKTVSTLTGDHENRITDYTSVVCEAVRVQYIVRRLTPTECARLQGFPDDWGHPDKKDDFTDEEYRFWLNVRNTHATINGKPQKDYTKVQMLTWYNKLHTDSAEYKMWGNGISLPTALYVMQGIAEALKGGEG